MVSTFAVEIPNASVTRRLEMGCPLRGNMIAGAKRVTAIDKKVLYSA
jgi:hypothetical protein